MYPFSLRASWPTIGDKSVRHSVTDADHQLIDTFSEILTMKNILNGWDVALWIS